MARKKISAYESENDTFPTKLRLLMSETKTSQETLANHLGVTRQSVGYYTQGQSSPDWRVLVKIAEYFHVSLDYLLTGFEIKSDLPAVRGACIYTDLSEDSIQNIYSIHNYSDDAMNRILALDAAGSSNGLLEAFKNEAETFAMLDKILSSKALLDYCRTFSRFGIELETIGEDLQELETSFDESAAGEDLISVFRQVDLLKRSLRIMQLETGDAAEKISSEVLALPAVLARCEALNERLIRAMTKD